MSFLAEPKGLAENPRQARKAQGSDRAVKGDIRMLRLLPKSFVLGLLALALPFAALASAVVQSMQGDARANGQPVTQNQRLNPGTTLTTGANSQLVLRFDDNQRVVLNQNTEFRIVDFRFQSPNPKDDRSILDLVKGALRIVTGTVAGRNQASFQLRTPQATIGVRGTDFMVAIVNPLYVSVLSGSVGLTSSAGTLVVGAGTFATVASSSALAVAVPAASVPAAATSAFGAMGAAPGVGAGAAGGAAGAAAGAGTATGMSTGAAVGIGVGIAAGAAAAAAASGDNGSTPTTTHH